MSLYFAHPTSSSTNQAVSKPVLDRGLSLLRAKPCEVLVTVIPASIQPGYASYISNLPAFMLATQSEKVLAIGTHGYPLPAIDNELPWQLPKVIYDFNKALSDREIDDLRKHSVVVVGFGRNSSFILQEPTIARIKELVAMGINTRTRHVFGTVNVDAMRMVYMLRRIFTAFLNTHIYPAFRHSSDIAPTDDTIVVVTKKRKVSTTSYVACVTDMEQHIQDHANTDEYLGDAIQPGDTIRLKYARPSVTDAVKWGSAATIPNASGLYVPYVKELAVADSVTVPDLVSNTFVRCLSESTAGMITKLDELKSAWGLISTTDLGHEITHLAKCVDIALRAQAMVYPVYSGTIYEGTVICGANYTLSISGRVMEPIEYASLTELVRNSSSHARSMSNIVAAVNDATILVGGCTNVRQLSNILKGVRLDEISRQKVVESARTLGFPNKYWSTTAHYIKRALTLLGTETAIPDDVPMLPTYMFATDRVELVLSAFGHQAPTFMIPSGKRCDLALQKIPKNLHIRTIAVESAVLDMKYVLENGYVTNDVENLSSKHRDTPLKGPDKKEAWSMLVSTYRQQHADDTKDDARKPAATAGGAPDDGLW